MKHNFRKHLGLLVIAWIISYVATNLGLRSLGISELAYCNLIVNTIFLIASIGCIRLLNLSPENVGLKIIRQRLGWHVGLCFAILAIYWLYYLFGVRISGLRPFTSATLLGLLNYLAVAFAEEVYFRGLWYQVVEKQFSGRVAVLISGLLFGLMHYSQGLGMLPRFFTGWLWGSVRYATGIFFPFRRIDGGNPDHCLVRIQQAHRYEERRNTWVKYKDI
ncbi:MAG: CPBP family intramembrane metalloprotease [Anaerolineales bacterium]|nr:MAG: CPBP family intramembrane metalloprotease [Anaerolineales bacterium]